MKALPTTPTSKSIYNKFRAPFVSKQHPQIKQEIQPDNPYREYVPGDSIKGKVVLDVPKPVRVTHLVIRLHGFVKVVTHSRLPGEAIPYDENLLNSTKGRKAGEYFGNGFAKLFEDEHVLCGDGRLYGKFEFRFEVILPATNVPSSIDFENGTITYTLTSTLTRPTTISPTLVENYKLKVKENIDIARTPKPRPQIVSLETVKSRRPVMHMKRKISGSNKLKDTSASQLEIRSSHTPDPSSTTSEAPRSPGPSEIDSAVSVGSSSTSNTRSGTHLNTGTDNRSMSSGLFSMSSLDKTITAQTEVLQGGCLPGDMLNIRVSVDHTKPIKSMQGVLITFYRLARIDTHPAIPLGPSNDINNARYEDYYPRSRTGLGGLSLSSAGSSRTFRQDLAQNIAPLIVDPLSLTAILKTSVHVPEHIFPSISGVPGSMISFKYFVEVIIDLRGKFGQDRLATKLSLTNTPQHSYEEAKIKVVDRDNGVTFSSTPGFNFLVTDQIRRQKGIVSTKTEVLVGTRDSARFSAKQKARESSRMDNGTVRTQQQANGQLPDYSPGENHILEAQHLSHQHNGYRTREFMQGSADIVPPATFEEPMDEKARIRQAEISLLPSAPSNEGSSSAAGELRPSAPRAFDEEDFHDRYNLRAPAPRYEAVSPNSIAGRSTDEPATLNTDPKHGNESLSRASKSNESATLAGTEMMNSFVPLSNGLHNEGANVNGAITAESNSQPRRSGLPNLSEEDVAQSLGTCTPIGSTTPTEQPLSVNRDPRFALVASGFDQTKDSVTRDMGEDAAISENLETATKNAEQQGSIESPAATAEVTNGTNVRAEGDAPTYRKYEL